MFGLVTDSGEASKTIDGLYEAEYIRTTLFHAGSYKSFADVEYATAGRVDWYKNRRCNGKLPSHRVRHLHYASLTEQFQPAWKWREPQALRVHRLAILFALGRLDNTHYTEQWTLTRQRRAGLLHDEPPRARSRSRCS